MQPVGVARRAVAVLIDSILLLVVGYFIALPLGLTTRAGFQLSGGPFFLWLLVFLGYYIVMEKAWGATLGKKAMGLKVVKQGGEPLDWKASIVRNVVRIIDSQLLYLVAAIAVWVTKNKQRLGDLAARTLVVSARSWLPIAAVALVSAVGAEPASAAPKYANAPAGTKLRCDWIAEKTKVAEPNYRIDSTELVAKAGMNKVTFSFSKPTAGWPEGDYRAELFIDGKPAEKVRFKVVK